MFWSIEIFNFQEQVKFLSKILQNVSLLIHTFYEILLDFINRFINNFQFKK